MKKSTAPSEPVPALRNSARPTPIPAEARSPPPRLAAARAQHPSALALGGAERRASLHRANHTSLRTPRGPAQPPPPPGRSKPRARSPAALGRRATRSCARRTVRPIVRLFRLLCGPAPPRQRAFSALWGWRREVESGAASECLRVGLLRVSLGESSRAPFLRSGHLSTLPLTWGLSRASGGFLPWWKEDTPPSSHES